MKITTLRTVTLACVAFVLLSIANQASAAVFSIHVGPPPREHHRDYERWESPGPGAVWIAGHNEWDDGRWVWVGGYWTYPPRHGGHWVPGHYSERTGQWRPGHWDY